MQPRHADGSAGDADYGRIGQGYARFRQPDPRIAAHIHAALGDARTVLNVGAGSGSYEPVDRAVVAVEARRYPPLATVAAALDGEVSITSVPIPLDCTDGFSEAYYGRPERLADPAARLAMSAWSFLDPAVNERFERTLRADLASGAWDARYGHLRRQPSFDGSLRLIVGQP